MLIVGSQLILNPLVVQFFLYTMLLLAIRSLLAPEQINHTDSVCSKIIKRIRRMKILLSYLRCSSTQRTLYCANRDKYTQPGVVLGLYF